MRRFFNNILSLLLKGVLVWGMCACTNEIKNISVETEDILGQLRARDMEKWAKERQLQQRQDESDRMYNQRVAEMYDAYYKALRDYKNSDHKIVYGWFGGWSATEGIPESFLSNLPDSVDAVSIWGGTAPFEENSSKWADLKYAQEVKGLRVLLCWQVGTSGLGLPGGVEDFDRRHEGRTSEEKAVIYAQELTEFIKKHHFNGYDIDWEPNVGNHGGGCHNLYQNCTGGESSAPIKAFIREMGKNFGPKQVTDYNPRNTGTLFLFDGEVRDLASRFGDMGDYFDYFLNQNYFGKEPNHEFRNVNAIKDFSWRKYITCDEFEMAGAWKQGGKSPGEGNLAGCEVKAKMVAERNYGGWGAYHIELEAAQNYKYVKSVTQIMNPSEGIKVDENQIENILNQ